MAGHTTCPPPLLHIFFHDFTSTTRFNTLSYDFLRNFLVMPSVRITNYTTSKLNVALKHICALHFDNAIEPGQTVKLKNVGRVWLTLEILVDDGKNHYSVANSAACIGIVSLSTTTFSDLVFTFSCAVLLAAATT